MLTCAKTFSLTMAVLLVLSLLPGAPIGGIYPERSRGAQGKPMAAVPSRTWISGIQADLFDSQIKDPLNSVNPLFSTADAENVEFVGHIGGATWAVAVQGDYAYIGEGPRLTT